MEKIKKKKTLVKRIFKKTRRKIFFPNLGLFGKQEPLKKEIHFLEIVVIRNFYERWKKKFTSINEI